jgi:hypothetical protein
MRWEQYLRQSVNDPGDGEYLKNKLVLRYTSVKCKMWQLGRVEQKQTLSKIKTAPTLFILATIYYDE